VNGTWQIEDLESTNGTQVNRELIKNPRELRNSDRITIGETWFRFSQEQVMGPPMPHHLGLLTPKEFEELMAVLLEAEGFTDVMVTGQSGDGGIDITAHCDRPFIQGRYVVQCKRYDARKRVPPSDVRAFHGVIAANPAVRGVFVTTSSFTKGARKFAENVGMPCIDGTQLVTLLVRHSLWPL
jgi:HJR/Mrr/RecB family endonuclease